MPKPTFHHLPDAKRQAILDVAIEEFAAHDYRAASVSRIAERARIAKGSLYQYFHDKRDLYLYLIQLAGEEKRRFLTQHPPPDPRMGLWEYLRWLMREGARFELSNPLLARVAYRGLVSERPFGDEPLDRMRQVVASYYDELVALGVAQGAIDPDIDRGLAVFLFDATFGGFGRYLMERGSVDLEALLGREVAFDDLLIAALSDQLIELLERALSPRTDPRRGNHAAR